MTYGEEIRMAKKKLPILSPAEEMFLDEPYGGLFGDTVMARVVEEIVSDPTQDFRPKYLVEMTGKSAKSIADALKKLTHLGLIEKNGDDNHPVYRVIVPSKKFVALSFLAYAMLDDRDGSDCMNAAIASYYHRVLREDYEPKAVATESSRPVQGKRMTAGDDVLRTYSGAA